MTALCLGALSSVLVACGSDEPETDAPTEPVGSVESTIWVLSQEAVLPISSDGVMGEAILIGGVAIDANDDAVWVAAEDGSAVLIDPAARRVVRTVRTGGETANRRTISVAPNGTAWVCDDRNGLFTIAEGADTAEPVTLPEDVTCRAVTAQLGEVWVATAGRDGETVGRLDAASGDIGSIVDGKLVATDLAAVDGGVFTVADSQSEMVRLDRDEAIFVMTGPVYGAVPVADALWTSGEGVVSRFDLDDRVFGDPIPLGDEGRPCPLTDGDGFLYAGVGEIYRIDPFTGATTVLVSADHPDFGARGLTVTVADSRAKEGG